MLQIRKMKTFIVQGLRRRYNGIRTMDIFSKPFL